MPRKKWLPKKGQIFDSRDSLEERLLESGWEFEGHGTGFAGGDGEITSYDVGVQDKKETVWILVDMEPVVRVTKIRKIKLPYKRGGRFELCIGEGEVGGRSMGFTFRSLRGRTLGL